MPIYTYRCENCGVQFEEQQKFTDTPLTRCPECSKKALRKVFQPVGIVFKGSGFYATDNRSPSGQNSRGHSSKNSDSEGGGESKSAESKPAKTDAAKSDSAKSD